MMNEEIRVDWYGGKSRKSNTAEIAPRSRGPRGGPLGRSKRSVRVSVLLRKHCPIGSESSRPASVSKNHPTLPLEGYAKPLIGFPQRLRVRPQGSDSLPMFEAQSEDLHAAGSEMTLPGSQTLWTVITSDARILSFRSAEEIKIAVLAGLLDPSDRLMRDGGAALGEHAEFSGSFALGNAPASLEAPQVRGPAPCEDDAPTVRPRSGNTQPYRLARRTDADTEAPPAAMDFSGARSRLPGSSPPHPSEEETPLGGIQVAPLAVAQTLEQAITGALGQPTQYVEPQSLFVDPLHRSRPPLARRASSLPPAMACTEYPEHEAAHGHSESSDVPPSGVASVAAPPVAHSTASTARVGQGRAAWGVGAVLLLFAAAVVAYAERGPRSPASVERAAVANAEASQVIAAAPAAPSSEGSKARAEALDTTIVARALEEGEYELAEKILTASLPEQQDAAQVLLLAHALVAQADAQWLRVRAQATYARSEVRSLELSRLASLARRAASTALRLAPEDGRALLLRIDALRISGELDLARELSRQLKDTDEPAAEYSLAALELAEPDGDARAAAARLRRSVGKLPGSAQTQAALTYALLRARHLEAARAELSRLELLVRPHPAHAALNGLFLRLRGNPAASPRTAPLACATSG